MRYLIQFFGLINFILLIFIFFSHNIYAEENSEKKILEEEINLNLEVKITEVQPFTLGEEDEWFEFKISKIDFLDLSDWSISNGKTQKKFKDIENLFIWNKNITQINDEKNPENKLIFDIQKDGYFSFTKSPMGLSDSGGEIKILNNEEVIVSQIIYPKLKKGTKNKKIYSEIWTLEEDENKFFPFIYFPEIQEKHHTKLEKNKKSPTFSEDFEMVISEISPDNKDKDFIEVFIKSGKSKINLKDFCLNLNGKDIWCFENNFFVKPQDFLVFKIGEEERVIQNKNPYIFEISKISGISKGSNSIALKIFSGTSSESVKDFVCFKNGKISSTEEKRVGKYKKLKIWDKECFSIKGLIENESVARFLEKNDTNTLQDFFRHFNGSAGKENISKNSSPTAIIKIQGSAKTIGTAPFSLNLTGEFSTDPDGSADIKNFIWKINNKIFSEAKNPKTYKIENIGNYKISLEIEDFSGKKDQKIIEIIVQAVKSINSGGVSKSQSDKEISALLQDSFNYKKLSTKQVVKSDNPLFAEILQNEVFIKKLIEESSRIKTPNYNLPFKKLPKPKRILRKIYLKKSEKNKERLKGRKIILPIQVQKRMKKNLGIIFSWREISWPALEEELIFYEEDRQKFEYFEAMYF